MVSPAKLVIAQVLLCMYCMITLLDATTRRPARLAGECWRSTPTRHCACCTGWWGSCGSCRPSCVGGCYNGGVCARPGVCRCADGFGGRKCEQSVRIPIRRAVCPTRCINGVCVRKDGANVCECKAGWTGAGCEMKEGKHRDCMWIWKISSTSGYIHSPNARFRLLKNPSVIRNYWSNMDCTQTLRGPEDMFLTITFMEFDFEENCQRDRLEVWKGTLPRGQLLLTACGKRIPNPISAFTNTMTFKMKTDSSVSGKGFKAEYSLRSNTFKPGECRKRIYVRDALRGQCYRKQHGTVAERAKHYGLPCSRFLGTTCECCPGYAGDCGQCRQVECKSPITKVERYVAKCGIFANCYRQRQVKIGHRCKCCGGYEGSCLFGCRSPYRAGEPVGKQRLLPGDEWKFHVSRNLIPKSFYDTPWLRIVILNVLGELWSLQSSLTQIQRPLASALSTASPPHARPPAPPPPPPPPQTQRSCGLPQVGNSAKIVGGQQVERGDWPWLAGVVWKNGTHANTNFCGGTLISDKWLVSTAHCFDDVNPSNWQILVGYHHRQGHDKVGEAIQPLRIIKHPQYKVDTIANDIAIIELSKAVRFNRFKGAMCLPQKNAKFAGQRCYTAGWGNTRYLGSLSIYPKQAEQTVLTNTDCKAKMPFSAAKNMIFPSSMCGLASGTSTCAGDSGGPLACAVGGRMVLVGATSWVVRGCKKHPSVYARITSYIDWIEDKLGTP